MRKLVCVSKLHWCKKNVGKVAMLLEARTFFYFVSAFLKISIHVFRRDAEVRTTETRSCGSVGVNTLVLYEDAQPEIKKTNSAKSKSTLH